MTRDDERKLFELWRGLGLSMRASNMLALFADATSPAKIYALRPAGLMGLPNVGSEDWSTEPYRSR